MTGDEAREDRLVSALLALLLFFFFFFFRDFRPASRIVDCLFSGETHQLSLFSFYTG